MKMRAQNNRTAMTSYSVLLPQILKNEGYRGLYKGFWATLLRDVSGLGFYFYTYEFLKKKFDIKIRKPGEPPKETSDLGKRIMCGGLAGTISWIVGFPLDVIKTQVMLNESNKNLRIKDVFVSNYRKYGFSIFYKGLTPALMRAFPRHAAVLTVFDYVSDHFHDC